MGRGLRKLGWDIVAVHTREKWRLHVMTVLTQRACLKEFISSMSLIPGEQFHSGRNSLVLIQLG